MKRTLQLRRETVADLTTDELGRIAGGTLTGRDCHAYTPTCPVVLSNGATQCETFPVLDCLVSGIACL